MANLVLIKKFPLARYMLSYASDEVCVYRVADLPLVASPMPAHDPYDDGTLGAKRLRARIATLKQEMLARKQHGDAT